MSLGFAHSHRRYEDRDVVARGPADRVLRALDPPGPGLTCLEREAIRDLVEIRRLFVRLAVEGTALQAGIDLEDELRPATVTTVCGRSMRIRVAGLEECPASPVYFKFEADGDGHRFAAAPLADSTSEDMHFELPQAVFHADRRDLRRYFALSDDWGSDRVLVLPPSGGVIAGRIEDHSTYGLGIDLPCSLDLEPEQRLRLCFARGRRKVTPSALVRHQRPSEGRSGWTRVGLWLAEMHRRRYPRPGLDFRI